MGDDLVTVHAQELEVLDHICAPRYINLQLPGSVLDEQREHLRGVTTTSQKKRMTDYWKQTMTLRGGNERARTRPNSPLIE